MSQRARSVSTMSPVAPPMNWLSMVTRPFVALLGASTHAVLRLMGLRDTGSRSVTEEEITAQLEEGLDAGVIEAQEHQMVRNVFRLDDRQIGSMMIPRAEIVWIDAAAELDDVVTAIVDNGHTRYPVCRGGLDDVIGVLGAHRLLQPLARGDRPVLSELLQPPIFVPICALKSAPGGISSTSMKTCSAPNSAPNRSHKRPALAALSSRR